MELTIAEMIREQASRLPAKTAIRFEGRDLTFGDLDRRTDQVAGALRALGLGAGDRLAVIDRNGPAILELLGGAAKVGVVLVGVNWRLSPPEMAFIVDDAGAALLAVGPEIAEQLDQFGALPSVRKIVAIGSVRGLESYDDWVAAAPPAAQPEHEAALDDVVIQMYTSGTTGHPKGALITNRNVAVEADVVTRINGLREDSRVLAAMPLYHIGGMATVLSGLWCGATVVLQRLVDPLAMLDVIERERITWSFIVPAVIQGMLASPGIDERDLSSIESVSYGASPISDVVTTRALELFGRISQVYGLTETTGAITSLSCEDHLAASGHPERLRSAGRAVDGHEVRVVDAEGNELPTGEVGEICLRGPLVMAGYWNRPDDTAAAIDPDGWFHSGDAGFVDAEGYVFIHDRIKDMIVSGAENVYPAEVENVLMAHPDADDVAVIGVPDERWGETVKAIVVVRPGSSPSPEELIAFAREHLARFKCPTSVDFVAELPRNPSGKILKRDLREPYWAGHDRRVH